MESSSSSAVGFQPGRRTAVVLAGEGTAVAYLAGVLKTLDASGLRMDLLVGKGVGALVAAFGCIQADDRLHGREGLLRIFAEIAPWRMQPLYKALALSLAVSFGAFLSPLFLALLLLALFPMLAVARLILPESAASWGPRAQSWALDLAAGAEPYYFRAIALPLIVFFGLLLMALLARFRRGGSGEGFFAHLEAFRQGIFDLSPLRRELSAKLWKAVRGASTDSRPAHPGDIGDRYRKLLSESFQQHGFRELLFYALDLDVGQEVPFLLLKERFLKSFRRRGPGQGAVAAEPLDLSSKTAGLLVPGLVAAVSPPGLTTGSLLRLPLENKHGGEVHRFSSSLAASQNAIADAVAAGAEQVIYVCGSAFGERPSASSWEALAEANLRQAFENELRWAEEHRDVGLFVIRPEKSLLGTFAFRGKALAGGERLELPALVAQGERDALRLFVQPVLGEVTGPPEPLTHPLPGRSEGLEAGPREL